MIIQLCRKSVGRLGPGLNALVSTLRDGEHTPVMSDCLGRCQACDKGVIVATVDGAPVSAATADKLLATVAALAEDA